MKPEEIKRWLKPEEITLYDRVLKALSENEAQLAEIKLNLKYSLDAALIGEAIGILKNHIAALESLARCRMLMDEAKQYIQDEQSGMPFDEEQVKELDNRGKEIYRKITAEIASLPGGGSNEPA